MKDTNWFSWWNSLTYEEKCEYNHELDNPPRCPKEYRHPVYKEEGRECGYCDFKGNK